MLLRLDKKNLNSDVTLKMYVEIPNINFKLLYSLLLNGFGTKINVLMLYLGASQTPLHKRMQVDKLSTTKEQRFSRQNSKSKSIQIIFRQLSILSKFSILNENMHMVRSVARPRLHCNALHISYVYYEKLVPILQ